MKVQTPRAQEAALLLPELGGGDLQGAPWTQKAALLLGWVPLLQLLHRPAALLLRLRRRQEDGQVKVQGRRHQEPRDPAALLLRLSRKRRGLQRQAALLLV